MNWWNDLMDWTASDAGWRVLSGAIIPFVAIVVAGVVAALIGRSATKRVVALQEREAKNAAVAAIISAARKAATWGSLGHDERAYADHLAEDADVRLRLLPVSGSPMAANWAQHEIADIKKNSSTFSFQAEQSLAEFRDRLLEWQARPNRARKLFKSDLERWKFESPDPDAELVKRQQDWNADQASARRADAQTPSTTSLRPAPRPGATVPPAENGTGSAPSNGPARSDGSGAPATVVPGATAATTPLGDGLTRPYGDVPETSAKAPVRPTLGTPVSRPASAPAASAPAGSAQPAAQRRTDDDETDVVDDAARPGVHDREVPPPVARPTAAEAHVNRPAATVSAPSTKSVSTRVDDAGAEPADAHETDEAPYTQPISANEIRRRSSDDDE
ncbi:hypothetical protein [Curtobacterium luteum]|uniref:hypothetical protein n=1 Tax=Curtobacterium luteum TaxID=33881 RepID=UPI00128F5BE0|nr:hypothetical protein [Curtobacterium luteum]